MKKKKTEINLFDEEMNNKKEAVFSAKESIRNKVYDIIAKKGVIDLYPEGADKEKAIQDLEQAKKSLICSIGAYDSALAEYKRYYTNNFEKISDRWTAPGDFGTSHYLVEMFYKHYAK